jgi:hypothetical protein
MGYPIDGRGIIVNASATVADLKVQIDTFPKKKPWTHVVEKDVDGIVRRA